MYLVGELSSNILRYVLHGKLLPEGVADDDDEGGMQDMSCFGECCVYLSWVADGVVLDSQTRRVDL